MISVEVVVFLRKNPVDGFSLIPKSCSSGKNLFYDDENCNCDSVPKKIFYESKIIENCSQIDFAFKIIMDGYLCSVFKCVLLNYLSYRTCFVNNVVKKLKNLKRFSRNRSVISVHVDLIPPHKEMLDYKGNEMFEVSCLERRELDNAMAWLSTLGGAFSALGDSMEECATIAGKISIRQLEIALRLGDPYLVARCKLYMALSLIQRQRFKSAKEIIRAQYLLATQGPVKDNKLKSMCLGIWAKLKYDISKSIKNGKKKGCLTD